MFFLAGPPGGAIAAAHLSGRHRAIRLAGALGLHAIAGARIQQLIDFQARQDLGAAQQFGNSWMRAKCSMVSILK